jgi:hypothetical protein
MTQRPAQPDQHAWPTQQAFGQLRYLTSPERAGAAEQAAVVDRVFEQ